MFFFLFEKLINVLVGSFASFEFLCYGAVGFDTLNHSILSDVLNYNGIKYCSLQLIRSYLTIQLQ